MDRADFLPAGTEPDPRPDPQAVLAAFGLLGPVTEMAPISGAWSNRVYRLDAGGASFALKELRNPWSLSRWEEWLVEASRFEMLAIGARVAAPVPIMTAEGAWFAWVERAAGGAPALVRLHEWVEGTRFDTGPVDAGVAVWAGTLLATLHALAVKPEDRTIFPTPNTDTIARWPHLTAAARRAAVPWAELMTAAAPSVTTIADLVRAAGHRPDDELMTHGDVDQKNLIASRHGPVLCDWDVAAPLVPRRELVDVAMSLAAWERFDIARHVVRAYRAAGGDDSDPESADLGQPLAVGLDWVALNIERAVGLRPAGHDECLLARSLVPGLLAAIPTQLEIALRVGEVLAM
jgi:hypothetical protein